MSIEAWDAVHKDRDWGRWPDIDFVRFTMQKFGRADRAHCMFLELGCGAGAQLGFLMREGFVGIGIEGSATAARKATEFIAPFGAGAVFVDDVVDMKTTIRPVECVFDVCTLQHIGYATRDVAPIIQRSRNLLKPGGWFFSKMATSPYAIELGDVPQPRRITMAGLSDLFTPIFGLSNWTYGRVEEYRNSGDVVSHFVVHAQRRN